MLTGFCQWTGANPARDAGRMTAPADPDPADPADPADRVLFCLDAADWVEFSARLHQPRQPKPRFARLLTGPAIWIDDDDDGGPGHLA